jgi:hypothetical protein
VCDTAADGPEKREMPEKMAISPSLIGDDAAQAAALKRVRRYYDESYTKVIGEIEALNKVLGAEYVRQGPRLFRDRKTGHLSGSASCAVDEKRFDLGLRRKDRKSIDGRVYDEKS